MNRCFYRTLVLAFIIKASVSYAGNTAGKPEFEFSQERIAAAAKYLSSDELGGRAPGSKGESLALDYLINQYKQIGLRPGNPDGTYLQSVPLVGTTLTASPGLKLTSADKTIELKYRLDFMAWSLKKYKTVDISDAEVVFAGYGIDAPEYGWNDFKDADVKGKIIIVLVGDPPLADKTMFDGKAMTYYGRWSYKFEAGAEKKAAGVLIVHNTDAAGYPWTVVANSWAAEQFDVVRGDKGDSRCAMEGWIAEDAAEKLFIRSGLSMKEAKEMSLSRDFKPVPLNFKASINFKHKFRAVKSSNVAALIEGEDPAGKKEFIIYTSHWDHLGFGPPVNGDSIYNGALDNASGVAGLLEIARAFAANKNKLTRSILFVNTTAEESGLLGSYYYAAHPLAPLNKTVAVINMDGLNIWGKTRDMVVVGRGFSALDKYLQAAVSSRGRYLSPDAEPEKGYYFRSDHFPFAKRGVPALYAGTGTEFIGRPAGWGEKIREKYTKEKYHKPQDEFSTAWNLDGAVEDLEALFRTGFALAGSSEFPNWNGKSPFKKLRDRMMESYH